ncbi:hypothetical protein T09_11494, partial [Trichinella sp. T9]
MALPSIVPEMCGFAYRRFYNRDFVSKYVITKHYHQLMPLSLATYTRKQTMDTYEDKWVSQVKVKVKKGVKPMGNMQIFICPQATPGAMPQAIF